MEKRGTVLASIVNAALTGAEALGVRRDFLLHKAEISWDSISNPESRILCSNYNTLWSAIEHHIRNPFFGLHLTEQQIDASTYGVVGLACKTSKNLKDALVTAAQYSRLLNETTVTHLHTSGNLVRLVDGAAPGFPQWSRHQSESALAAYVTLGRKWTGMNLRPAYVAFAHSKPANISEHERIFGCPVYFDHPCSEIAMRAEDLRRPVFNADDELRNYLIKRADLMLNELNGPDDLLGIVRSAIERGFRTHRLELSEVADDLCLSPRTLQRRLADQGWSFRTIVDDERCKLAKSLLEDRSLTVKEITSQLGFSEAKAFRRAFQRWTGSSVQAYRQYLNTRDQGHTQSDKQDSSNHRVA